MELLYGKEKLQSFQQRLGSEVEERMTELLMCWRKRQRCISDAVPEAAIVASPATGSSRLILKPWHCSLICKSSILVIWAILSDFDMVRTTPPTWNDKRGVD
ncbi:hypothetical protein QE152_g32376 [Popillia japonica]|uniref:Uncharacterized protein n=1 Tax=Popillia japonica TaxID=7064 RepID=A0AAW1IZ02_POPJA